MGKKCVMAGCGAGLGEHTVASWVSSDESWEEKIQVSVSKLQKSEDLKGVSFQHIRNGQYEEDQGHHDWPQEPELDLSIGGTF